MTLPRQFLPNTTYFITRRTTQREFWLKPTSQTTAIFLYCIAVAAQKTGVQLHAVCAMSNHWHAVVSDPEARIADFYAWVHKYTAKAINCSEGRGENLWSSEKTSVIALESPEDVMDKMAYCLCNPVKARLTAKARNWKGVWLFRQRHSRVVRRPEIYFQTNGTMPETAELRIHLPQSHHNFSTDAFENMIEQEVQRREEQIAREMQAAGQSFLGMDAVLRQFRNDRPKSPEVRGRRTPGFAAKDVALRVRAIERYRQFVSDYWQALKLWKAGDHNIIFPAGTFAMRIHAGVNVASG